jgi:hypothetical protein
MQRDDHLEIVLVRFGGVNGLRSLVKCVEFLLLRDLLPVAQCRRTF